MSKITAYKLAHKILEASRDHLYVFLISPTLQHVKFHAKIYGMTIIYNCEKSKNGSDWVMKLEANYPSPPTEAQKATFENAVKIVYKEIGLSTESTFNSKYVR